MHFDLYVPDFFSAEGVPPADSLAAAETLIARGRRKRIASVSPEAWLFGRFGVERQRDWPVAPYTLLADGGAPERHFWMRADPVHLRYVVQILRLRGEPLGESPGPTVDQRQAQRPSHRGRVAVRHQTPPGQPPRPVRSPGDDQNRDPQREGRTRADVRQPGSVQRSGIGVYRHPPVIEQHTDEDGRRDERDLDREHNQVGSAGFGDIDLRHSCRITLPVRGGALVDPAQLSALRKIRLSGKDSVSTITPHCAPLRA